MKSRTYVGLLTLFSVPFAASANGHSFMGAGITSAQPVGTSSAAQLVSSSQNSYSYAPTTLLDADGTYKMWFCGNHAGGIGDGIFYSTAPGPYGPWTQPVEVFSAQPGQFDSQDVCDPSVIKSPDGTYLLYYGAASHDDALSNGGQAWTSIGMAASRDGVSWTRVTDAQGNDRQIVTPANPADPSYGAGQPSVVFDSSTDTYAMLYTDSTKGGDNLYAIRSLDPTFASGVQVLQLGSGWVTDPGAANRPALQPGADADWALDGPQWVIAGNGGGQLVLATLNVSGLYGITQDSTGAGLVGDAGLVHNADGTLAWDGTQFNVSCTVADPSKGGSASNPWTWSIGNVGLALPQ